MSTSNRRKRIARRAPPASRPLIGFDPEWRARVESLDLANILPPLPNPLLWHLERKLRQTLLAFPALVATYDKTFTPEKIHAELAVLCKQIEQCQRRIEGTLTSELLRLFALLTEIEQGRLEAEFVGSGARARQTALKQTGQTIFLMLFRLWPSANPREHYRLMFEIFDQLGLEHPSIDQSAQSIARFFKIEWTAKP